MATLSYDLSVLGFGKVDQAFAQIERRAGVHNQRMRKGSGSKAAERQQMSQADRLQHDAKKARDRDLHREAIRDINKEHNKRMASIRQEHLARKKANADSARQQVAQRRAMTGAIGRSALGSVSAIGRGASMVGMIGGGAIIGAGISKHLQVSKSAAALANKAFGTPGETRSREQIQADLMRQSKQIGDVTGNRAGLIEAIDKFVAISGNLRAGEQMGRFMADISDATGAEMGDVGRTGGQVMQALMARGVDEQDAIKQTEEILSSMAAQAKIGSIEFSDLATQMGKVISSTARFDGRVSDLTATMASMAQLAIAGGASSPEEATTAILRFSDDLVQNAGRWDKMMKEAKARGEIKGDAPSFFTDESKTQLRGPEEIMFDIFRQTGGDLTKIKKLFGIRSMKALEPFQQSFAVFSRAADKEGGIEAVKKQMDRFKAARMSPEEVRKSATFTREQTGRSIQVEWERLTQEVGQQLAPALHDLIPSLKELFAAVAKGTPYIAAFFEYLAKNPFEAIVRILVAKVAMDVAAAGIGAAIRNAALRQMTAGAPVTGGAGAGIGGRGARGGPGAVTAGGAVNAVGVGLAAGTAVASLIDIAGKTEVNKRETESNKLIKGAASGSREGILQAARKADELKQEQSRLYGELPEQLDWGPMKWGADAKNALVGLLDPLKEQRTSEIKSLEQSVEQGQGKIKSEQAAKEFTAGVEGTLASFAKFKAELDSFSAPKVHRGNKPESAIKD